jgi:hypothetical protein
MEESIVLDLRGRKQITDPEEKLIAACVRNLDGVDDSFIAMSKQPSGWFLQAGGGPDMFVVEYCEEEGKVFHCDDVPQETVIRMFRAYSCGDDAWRSEVRWEELSETQGKIEWFVDDEPAKRPFLTTGEIIVGVAILVFIAIMLLRVWLWGWPGN